MRNNKGFISTLFLGLGALVITSALVFVSAKLGYEKKLADLEEKIEVLQEGDIGFGVATGSGSFPSSTNNFQDGDVINAGDWNQLEYAIGTTTLGVSSSSRTNSLYYLVSNASSSDPGHKHTTSTITGITYTKQVSEGGTATTTFNKGIVMASGTDAFTSLQTNGNGSIPIASGTSWTAGQLIAGTNVTLTTSTGSITIAAASNVSTAFSHTQRAIGNSTPYVVIATSSDFGAIGANDAFDILIKFTTAGGTVNYNLKVNGTVLASTSLTSNRNPLIYLRVGNVNATGSQAIVGYRAEVDDDFTLVNDTATANLSTTSIFTFSASAANTDANTKLYLFDITKIKADSNF